MDKVRCKWCNLNNPLYVKYHDEEWCVPTYDDNVLHEFLILEAFQAGLSWETILNKRENFRRAFENYDKMGEKTLVETDRLVAAMEAEDIYGVAKCMANDLEKAAGSEDTRPIKEMLIEKGAIGSVMTGSGAAVFGVFDDEEKAKQAVEYFRGRVRSVFLTKPVNHGAVVAKERSRYRKR